jgi:hypothetical protein
MVGFLAFFEVGAQMPGGEGSPLNRELLRRADHEPVIHSNQRQALKISGFSLEWITSGGVKASKGQGAVGRLFATTLTSSLCRG